MPSALITTASTGLSDCAALYRARDRGRDLVGARDDRRDEEHDQRVEPRVGEQRRDRLLVGRAGRRAEHVDRVRDARRRPAARLASAARVSVRELRQLEPGRLAGVGAEDAEPAGVREHADAAPARQRLAREQACDVDELLERPRAQHARLVEERVDRGVGAGERGRVRARGPRAGRGRAGLQREDRLAARDAARERARTCAGCRTTRGRAARASVSGSSSHHSSRSFDETSALFPIETKAEKPSRARALLEQREPERAALRREPDPARRQRARREGRVQLRLEEAMPRQFGPTSRAPCARTSASSCSWRSRPSAPISAKPAEITQSARTPFAQRLLRRLEHARARAGR